MRHVPRLLEARVSEAARALVVAADVAPKGVERLVVHGAAKSASPTRVVAPGVESVTLEELVTRLKADVTLRKARGRTKDAPRAVPLP